MAQFRTSRGGALYGEVYDDRANFGEGDWRPSSYNDFLSAGTADWSDPNSPLWQYIGGANGIDWTRQQMASSPERAMQFLSKLAPNPSDWGPVIQGYGQTGLGDPQGLAQAVRGGYEANYNNQGGFLDKAEGFIMPAVMALMGNVAGAAGAFGGGSASAGGTSASAVTGTGEPGMWDWLDQFSGVPDDLGYDFVPGESLTNPLSGIPDDLGWDFPVNDPLSDSSWLNEVDPGAGTGLPGAPSMPSWLSKYGMQALNFGKGLLGGGNASGGGTRSTGGGVLDTLRNNPLEAAFNATPFLLALTEANRQGKDLNEVLERVSGGGFAKSVLNPYDMDTGIGRANMLQDQQLRGVRGSSFGNNDISSYDYMRSMGRGDLFNRANTAEANVQGNLINTRNTNRNLLLGAGLNASGRMFQPEDPFGLKNLYASVLRKQLGS